MEPCSDVWSRGGGPLIALEHLRADEGQRCGDVAGAQQRPQLGSDTGAGRRVHPVEHEGQDPVGVLRGQLDRGQRRRGTTRRDVVERGQHALGEVLHGGDPVPGAGAELTGDVAIGQAGDVAEDRAQVDGELDVAGAGTQVVDDPGDLLVGHLLHRRRRQHRAQVRGDQ
ncbi:hypothetical protein [Candidatus Frankia alpina]|uniref:hypothetical protein n=1 Tax=Candidatus Frankia alpina TaxID=2699483 RepID=UPI002E2595D8